jgi:hypothetical protein
MGRVLPITGAGVGETPEGGDMGAYLSDCGGGVGYAFPPADSLEGRFFRAA